MAQLHNFFQILNFVTYFSFGSNHAVVLFLTNLSFISLWSYSGNFDATRVGEGKISEGCSGRGECCSICPLESAI